MLCLLALVAGIARRSLQLIQCAGDISAVAAVLEAALAIVLPALIYGMRCLPDRAGRTEWRRSIDFCAWRQCP